MPVRQISVLSENHLGVVQRLASVLTDGGINIRAVSVADAQSLSILRLVVNDTDAALKILSSAGFTVTVNPVMVVGIDNRPGELLRVASLLAENELSIEYMYAFTVPSPRRVYLAVRVANVYAAEVVMEAAGVPLLDDDALRDL